MTDSLLMWALGFVGYVLSGQGRGLWARGFGLEVVCGRIDSLEQKRKLSFAKKVDLRYLGWILTDWRLEAESQTNNERS